MDDDMFNFDGNIYQIIHLKDHLFSRLLKRCICYTIKSDEDDLILMNKILC